ncbi:MAG TPA: penicillin-binding protein [Acidobacteriota bacterium]|nr:penicillin-binding protein [Acidobacteriota bacterium]
MNRGAKSQTSYGFIRVHRLVLIYALVMMWALGIGVRLVYLQVVQADKYRTLAQEQQSGFIEVSSRRGEIRDRHLDDLAISVRADSLYAEPAKISKPLETAQTLAPILNMEANEIHKKLLSRREFVYLARRLEPEQVARIKQLELPGLGFQKESKRVYPGGPLACHIVGFVGLDDEGLSGLEYLYDKVLKGSKTKVSLRVNARRESFERLTDVRLSDGHTLILNLDRSIQFTVEQVLKETVDKFQAVNGSAIVMDPNNGEILAMASYPTFDPNQYQRSDEEARRNRGILEIYEPGSTFKIITMAAVLNEGLSYPNEPVDCRVGTLRLAGKVYREAKRSYGTLTFNQILAKSSNVGTIKLGLRLGNDRLYSYIQRFGFGAKTGIELPGEQTGLLRPPSEWSKISIGALCIGQEIGVTPIQMLRALAVIGNGGYLVEPRLVRRILTADGDIYYRPETKRVRILSEDTAARMKEALALVVDEGTGRSATVEGYTSAGKTGTAQKFINGRYSHSKFVASYVGFAPLAEPRLAAIVVINEPKGQYYGGLVAAPAFSRIMERALMYLNVPQDRPLTPEDGKSPRRGRRRAEPRLDVVRAEVPGWSEESEIPENLEATVLSLIGENTPTSAASGRVTVNTDLVELPDFTGWNLRDVAREGARLGLRMKISGTGTAVAQRPPAGSRVARQTVCEVFFSVAHFSRPRPEPAQSAELSRKFASTKPDAAATR